MDKNYRYIDMNYNQIDRNYRQIDRQIRHILDRSQLIVINGTNQK